MAGVGGRDILHCQGKIFQKRVKNVGKISWYGKIVGNHHNITNVVKSVDFLKGCNTSYRRESIPPLDENLGLGRETRTDPHWEIDIGLLIKKSGRKILFDPHIMVDHYINTPAQEWLDRGTAAARNEIYILFKHLGILRKAVYLFYIFCIGQKTNPGFVWFILDIFETGGIRNAWNRFSIFTKCKIEGIKLYFRKYKNLKA